MKEVKVLGPGCSKCQELMKLTEQAVKELRIECTVEKVTDIQQIMSYDVLMTPALVVDGQVKATGKVPSLDDLKGMLTE